MSSANIDLRPLPDFRVIFIGDTGVGKTSIINRKKNKNFEFKVDPTIGAGTTAIEVIYDDIPTELRIWDTPGQEEYNILMNIFMRGVIVAVIVASCIDQRSIDNIDKWIDMLKENGEDPEKIVVINKWDYIQASPNFKLVSDIQQKYKNSFFVSAKTGYNIDELFNKIAALALNLEVPQEVVRSVVLEELTADHHEKHKKCC